MIEFSYFYYFFIFSKNSLVWDDGPLVVFLFAKLDFLSSFLLTDLFLFTDGFYFGFDWTSSK